MLDLGYLLKVYQHIEFGASGVIHLLTRDGQEVLEWRPEGLVLNPEPRHFPLFASQQNSTGTLVSPLFDDGERYLSSFREAERFPFRLVVSRSLSDILALHQRARSQTLSTLAFLTLLIAAGAYLIVKGISRQGRLFSALTASNEENRSLIARLEDEKSRAFMLAAHDHLTGLPSCSPASHRSMT